MQAIHILMEQQALLMWGVKATGKGTTVVNVGYFSDNGTNYLGQYEEINGSFVPTNTDEACLFAYNNYDNRY